MTAVADHTPPNTEPEPRPPAFLSADLTLIQVSVDNATRSSADVGDDTFPEAELIDRIAHLETLQNTLAAIQATLIRSFARAHLTSEITSGTVEPEKLERSVGAQIGLACRVSPTVGRTRVRTARDLHDGLDHLRTLFTAGELSEYRVSIVVAATAHLDADERSEVDRLLADHDIAHLSTGRLRTLARSLAAQVAPDKFRARVAAARCGRRVTLHPGEDGMTDLIAHLPVEQGVACYAALQKAVTEVWASPEPVFRGRGQIMADTLVERLTGKAHAHDVDVQVQVVVPVGALVDPRSPLPAEIPGHGPVPVDLLATTKGRKTWRRLVTRNGIVIGGDSQQRAFTGALATFIRARDHLRCTEPYCDAPAREIDHIRQEADGGRSTFTNARSVCQFHNLLRELPGWQVERTPDGGVRTTTPTGHSYVSRPRR